MPKKIENYFLKSLRATLGAVSPRIDVCLVDRASPKNMVISDHPWVRNSTIRCLAMLYDVV